MGLTTWAMLAVLAIGCILAARPLFHYFQLESYQFPGYFRTLRRNLLKAILPGVVMNAVLLLGATILPSVLKERIWLLVTEAALWLLAGFLIRLAFTDRKAKKPLNYTPRMKRLYVTAFIVFWLLLALFSSIGTRYDPVKQETVTNGWIAFCALFPALLPLWVALAGLLAWPLEKLITELYFRDARRMLNERPDLIKIGITGSWGKTSVKFILGTLLEEKYHTLVTPASFNTPMGVTRAIRTLLEPGHRVFVAEMGARHVGDVKELCRLVHPSLGVITSVGPQHLDTFKTVERVTKAKYELIQALPEDGAGFFADDGDICLSLHEKTYKEKMLAGLNPERDDVWAEEIRVTPEGSRFLLCTPGARIPCETELLGELNIRNIVLAASVCLKLGLTEKQIARGIRKLKPVEHRLQLIRSAGGMTVIDDAFNSNIRGAEQALEVLKEFPARRIVVTPGMVELGEQEQELNRQLGLKMAACCDEAVLVGLKRSEPIAAGLKEAGFPEERIHAVPSLQEARAWVSRTAGSGDTVLFENDLPDNYTE